MICIEEHPYGVCFHVAKTGHLDKKFLPCLLMLCRMNRASRTQMKTIAVVTIHARPGFTAEEWMKKMWHIYTMEYSAEKITES